MKKHLKFSNAKLNAGHTQTTRSTKLAAHLFVPRPELALIFKLAAMLTTFACFISAFTTSCPLHVVR